MLAGRRMPGHRCADNMLFLISFLSSQAPRRLRKYNRSHDDSAKRGFKLKLEEERKPREARAPSARQSRVRDQGSELSQRRVFRLHSQFSPYLLQLPTITS